MSQDQWEAEVAIATALLIICQRQLTMMKNATNTPSELDRIDRATNLATEALRSLEGLEHPF